MKRCVTLLLATVLLLAMTCMVSAQEAVTVSVGAIEGAVGDIVKVPVSVSENHYMVNGRILLTFDPTVLELQTVCDNADNPYFETVNTAILDNSFMYAFTASNEKGKANFVFSTAQTSGNAVGGVIYTLTFKLLKETAGSAIVATIPEIRTNTGAGDATADVTIVNGTVEVTAPEVSMRGDTNTDGRVNLSDATRLFYSVNGLLELTPRQKLNADLVNNGIINLDDATRLFYFVAGMGEL